MNYLLYTHHRLKRKCNGLSDTSKIIAGIIAPIILYLITIKVIDLIENCDPYNFEQTWYIWIITILIVAYIENLLFNKTNDDSENIYDDNYYQKKKQIKQSSPTFKRENITPKNSSAINILVSGSIILVGILILFHLIIYWWILLFWVGIWLIFFKDK